MPNTANRIDYKTDRRTVVKITLVATAVIGFILLLALTPDNPKSGSSSGPASIRTTQVTVPGSADDLRSKVLAVAPSFSQDLSKYVALRESTCRLVETGLNRSQIYNINYVGLTTGAVSPGSRIAPDVANVVTQFGLDYC